MPWLRARATADVFDRTAWAFFFAGFALAGADAVALAWQGFVEPEQGEALLFLPRLLIGVPLVLGCAAWLVATSRAGLEARLGARAGWVVDLACACPFIACVLDLLSGPRISISPWRWPLLLLGTLGSIAGVVLLRVLAKRAAASKSRSLVSVSAFACVLLVTAGGAALSMRWFHHLYPALHQLLAFLVLALSAAGFFAMLALAPRARRFFFPLVLVLACATWLGSAALTWHSAGGRLVLTESAPFAGAFVPVMFRSDAALMTLGARSAASSGETHGPLQPPLASLSFLPDAKKPSLFLVTIDALRADVLEPGSAYAVATPGLRRVAEHALRFERAYASSNSTNYSLPVLISGVVHGTGLMEPGQFMQTLLSQNGYDTLAWVTNNFRRDEDEIVKLREAGYHCRAFSTKYAGADEVIAWARGVLEGPKPQLVWIHLSDVHSPYWLPEKPAPAGRVYPNEYARRLAVVDELLAPLLEKLQSTPGFVWALSSDHGEALGEHGTWAHASTLYDEQLRVPLVIGGTGLPAGRVAEPVSTSDLARTLLSLAGVRLAPNMTMLPPFAARQERASAPVLSYMPAQCSIVRGDHKLIADTAAQTLALFDLKNDPAELHNRLHDEPALARTLLAALRDAGCTADLRLLEASLAR